MKRVYQGMFVFGLVFVLMGAFLIGPGQSGAKEKVVVQGDTSSIPTLEPGVIMLGATINLWQNLFQGLVKYKYNSLTEVEGDAAESWTISDDGLVYTFRLRDNNQFHKGFGKVTAEDVKFSFERIMDPKKNSPFMGDLRMVNEVRVVDDRTVRIYLKYFDPDFIRRCARPQPVSIVSKKAMEQYGETFGRNPIGSGPFEFQSMSREQTVLTANKNYFLGVPEIDKVIFKVVPDMDTLILALVNGDVDTAWSLVRTEDALGRLKAAGCTVKGIDRGGYMQFLMNSRLKPYDDIRVRRAIAHAIDKDAMIKHVIAGVGERWNSLIPKGYWGYTEEGLRPYEYDPEKSKQLLAEAGYSNGFEDTIICNTTPSSLPHTQAGVGYLSKVGIKLKIDAMDNAAWKRKYTSGEAHLSMHLDARMAGAQAHLNNYLSSDGFPPGPNLSWYDKSDKEIKEAGREKNDAKRLKMYHDIQKKLMEDLPHIPLYMCLYPGAFRSHLTGLPDRAAMFGYDYYYVRFK